MLSLVVFIVLLLLCPCCKSCPLILRTNALVERKLQQQGFHRSLETLVALSTSENLESCEILVREDIPSGAYVDPYQLHFLKEFGGPQVFVPQVVNIETPEHLSPRLTAYFFVKPVRSKDDNWAVNFSVPVHFRYHRAESGSVRPLEVKVEIPHPAVFLLCDYMPDECSAYTHREPCSHDEDSECEWLLVNTYSTTEPVWGIIPVGNTDLLDTVLLTTISITCAGTLILLAAIIKNEPAG